MADGRICKKELLITGMFFVPSLEIMLYFSCGKTTQVPQFILDLYLTSDDLHLCNIMCTQPRRISAIAVAERVAEERNDVLGKIVGYQIRLEKMQVSFYSKISSVFAPNWPWSECHIWVKVTVFQKEHSEYESECCIDLYIQMRIFALQSSFNGNTFVENCPWEWIYFRLVR